MLENWVQCSQFRLLNYLGLTGLRDFRIQTQAKHDKAHPYGEKQRRVDGRTHGGVGAQGVETPNPVEGAVRLPGLGL